MTRLTENDIAGIEAEWATYERRLEELTGDDLLTLAARTLGIDPETARSGVRELRVGAIPISSGEGLIGGFADSLASRPMCFRLMCPVFSSPRVADLICSSGPMTIRIWLRTSLLVPWAKTAGPRGAGSPPP
jgi:pyrrolysine biosynthesis protein PylD